MPRVFDCFPFFNELDILEIRLAELDALVDHFVIVEATHTQTGNPKPLYFSDNRKRYDRYAHKIIHIVVDDLPLEAPSHWTREIHQREAIMRGLGDARSDDLIVTSDCDEIPKPEHLRRAIQFRGWSRRVVAFWCENYFHRLNLRNDAHDHRLGPRMLTMRNLRRVSPDALRAIQFRFSKRRYLRPLAAPFASLRASKRIGTALWPTIFWNGAWHFTSMGDVATVNLKFASVAEIDQFPPMTEDAFKKRMSTFSRRPLTELPRTIQQEQERFAHLIA
jgi:beta-1,4-mannosyl-glycoprotein beta-1,4-N-acetylglucosaminyltransferase